MHHREVFDGSFRNHNERGPFSGRWKRGEKRERKVTDSVAEFGTIRSVPGIDGIERFEFRDARPFHHSQQVQGCVCESPGAIGEPDQREQRARGPDFGISGAGPFQRGKRKNDVANRPRANKESTVNG